MITKPKYIDTPRKKALLHIPRFFGWKHERCGQQTEFRAKMRNKEMIHWVHRNTNKWKKAVPKVNHGTHSLILYEHVRNSWTSPRYEFLELRQLRTQRIDMDDRGILYIEGKRINNMELFCKRCGLSVKDFYGYHSKAFEDYTLIHFTYLTY